MDKLDFLRTVEKAGYDMQFPHCDALVLHAPEECQFCDAHPDWQYLRMHWGIAFTGEDPVAGQVQCPAERERPRDKVNRWGGNTPSPKGGVFVGYKQMYPQYVKPEAAKKFLVGLRDSLTRIMERTRD